MRLIRAVNACGRSDPHRCTPGVRDPQCVYRLTECHNPRHNLLYLVSLVESLKFEGYWHVIVDAPMPQQSGFEKDSPPDESEIIAFTHFIPLAGRAARIAPTEKY